MLFYVIFFAFAPALGLLYLFLAAFRIAEYLYPILKAAFFGIAAIVLLPHLLSVVPVIIVLAALVAVVRGVKRIVGCLLG